MKKIVIILISCVFVFCSGSVGFKKGEKTKEKIQNQETSAVEGIFNVNDLASRLPGSVEIFILDSNDELITVEIFDPDNNITIGGFIDRIKGKFTLNQDDIAEPMGCYPRCYGAYQCVNHTLYCYSCWVGSIGQQ